MRTHSAAAAFLVSLFLQSAGIAQTLEVGARGAIRIEIDRIEARVEDGVARIEVDETFRNTGAAVLEGVYRFKLPADAVVGAFSMWMEGREKQGRVLEAKEARATYDSIVRKKRDPGLLEQTGWRDFRVSVYPIPARDTVRIKLVYSNLLRDDAGLETLEIPLPQDAGVIGDLRVHVTVAGSQLPAGLDCPSHREAKLTVGDAGAEATLTGDGVAPSGPFVLRAIPRKKSGEFGVTLLADRAAGSERGFFVARVVPRLAEPTPIARDLVFVIDRSGSMQGRKIEQARAALLAGLDSLRPGDRFDVVSFSTDVTTLGDGRLLEVNEENLARARRFAREITASGGTNIRDALLDAIRSREETKGRLFAVVFLTDGDPTVGETNPDRILETWRQKADGVRLFAFGVGDDVKEFLLTKLATEGRGEARYVRQDDDLEVPLAALFDRVRTPLLLDPVVDVEGDSVEVVDREPRRLPDLFQGRTLIVSGRFKGTGKAVLHLRGRAGERPVVVDVPVEFPAATPARPHVGQIWAKARVERLLDDMRTLGANGEIRQEILNLGLEHQLVTPYTSFLVVEDGVKLARDGDDPNRRGARADEGTAFDRTPGFNGPQDSMPPGLRASPSGGTVGPSGPGGPATGGPPMSGGATPGGQGGVRGGSGGLTGRRSSAEGYERWEFWWEQNRDAFLATDGSIGAADAAVKRPTGQGMNGLLRPVLLDALASSDGELADAAALALARTLPAADADPKIVDALIAALGHPAPTVRQSATLALGVLGRPEAVGPLRALLLDTEMGRDLTKAGDRVEPLVRAFAAASLGLLHADDAIDDLLAVARGSEPQARNAQTLALLALGMMEARQVEIASFLAGVTDDRSVNTIVRAQAPIALAKLARGSDVGRDAVHALLATRLVPLFRDEKSDNDVRRSLAIALGSIATVADGDAFDAAMDAVADSKDDQTRHFAILALAKIGAADSTPADQAPAHAKLLQLLFHELQTPWRITHQPIAALGLGIYARNPALAPEVRPRAVSVLRAAFAATTNPSYQGAMAVALGLLGARDAADELWQRYLDTNDDPLKGYIAVALAQMGVTSHAAELRRDLLNRGHEYEFRIELARALGSMRDVEAVPDLIELLEHGETLAESTAAAQALGRIGDPRAVAPLLALAKDTTRSPLVRGLAVTALGLLGEKTPLPWSAAFSIDCNYRAKSPALAELLDLL